LDVVLRRKPGEEVGSYAITVDSLDAGPNYTVHTVGAVFHITKAELTITADAASKVYGATDPDLSFTAEGLVDGDSIRGAPTRDPGKNVGVYTIHTEDLDAGPNYTVTYVDADFTITPAPLTLSANPGQHKVQGHSDPTLTFS